jgi:DNA-binding transcriptional MerR regulator
MANYLKGQIADIAQINPETLRFYEKIKLIPAPMRTKSGYRVYSEAVLNRLEFIKNAKASGFTLKQIKEMFNFIENRDADFEDIAKAVNEKITEIDSRISSLEEMKSALILFTNEGEKSIQCPHIHAFLHNFKEA